MEYDIIIVGAGASGLVAAITAARKGSSVLVIEQKDKAGKKILATGNGKCNYTNLYQEPECYRSEDSTFAMKVLSNFDTQSTIAFFEELGIFPRERSGYLYPNSEQAASVLQVLMIECERLGVDFIYEEKVKEINSPYYTVIADTLTQPVKQKKYFAKKLILATGGCASSKLGSDGSGYLLAKSLGHALIKPLPALVQLKSADKFCKTLSGVRTTARVTAYQEKKILSMEEGELVFTDYGISGIPILQISRFVAKALDHKEKVHLIIDFLPMYTTEEVQKLLQSRVQQNLLKNLEQMMVGLFNHKLTYIMIKEAKLDPYLSLKTLKKRDLEQLSLQIKEFRMNIHDTNSFENAQVTAGGVPTNEIDPATMESKRNKRLYLTGELVDVDGTCGGYNLQWAWSSGYLAGSAAGEK